MKKPNDEYAKIYERYEGSGFELSYDDQQLGESQPIFKESIDILDSSKHNNDEIPLFVKCEKCSEYMNFEAGPTDELDGHWECPVCGSIVDEYLVYDKIQNENFEDEEEYNKLYNEDFDDFC